MSTGDRIVRLQSVDKRYRATVYPSVPIKDETTNTYLTGQHIDPTNPKSQGNLTMAEMTHMVQLSAEKMAKFPFVIYPETRDPKGLVITTVFPLKHGDKFNIGVDATGQNLSPKDHAMYNYCRFLYPTVVMSKKDVRPGETMFYMEDLAAEAEVRVKKGDLEFEAEMLVRSANLDKYRELALLLNYKLKGFNINIGSLTETQVKDKMIQACKDSPAEVKECFSKEVKDDLFVLRLKDKGYLTMKNGSFYDGTLFIGQTLEQVKAFMYTAGNQDTLTKWGRLLENV